MGRYTNLCTFTFIPRPPLFEPNLVTPLLHRKQSSNIAADVPSADETSAYS